MLEKKQHGNLDTQLPEKPDTPCEDDFNGDLVEPDRRQIAIKGARKDHE